MPAQAMTTAMSNLREQAREEMAALHEQVRSRTMAAAMAALHQRVRNGEVGAWPVKLAVDALNVAYPDPNAAYFIMLYMLAPGQSLVLQGSYPFARFSSLTTYYGLGVPGQGIELLGWLRDAQIAPDPGSVNPAVDPNASDDPAQRQWTVRVTGTAVVDGTTPGAATPTANPAAGGNVIPAHREGATDELGALVLRIYLPDDPADPTGGVGLPALRIEEADGSSRPLAACTTAEERTWTEAVGQMVAINVEAAPRLPVPPDPDTTPAWVESRIPGLGPNPDNRYLMAPVVWQPGRIVVIRGQAPTFPDTRAGQSPMTPAQLRYWSFCTGSNVITYPSLYPTMAGISDFAIPLGPDGGYTVVVSQPEDRPANATPDHGVAWLQGADPARPDLVLLRHMLPAEAFFAQSVWAVPELVVGAAQPIMGPYYPETVYSDTATFAAGGAAACFAAAEAGATTA
jgi:hypothetical protein